ncbi:MAG: ATP-dependent helicase [SAR324 cluster bacterium]|nr:ATP-dependent helicase [SAR324 cluster bacterium]
MNTFKYNPEDLNPSQQRIVAHHEGPALVIAGAGSGKTRVIIHRIMQLVQNGVAPETIMVLTFTNKAANEISHRSAMGLQKHSSRIVHGTFHSIANRFLRKYASLLKYSNNFNILDSSDAGELVKSAMAQTVGKTGKSFPKAAVLHELFSLGFNRYCNEDLLKPAYPIRNFQIEKLVMEEYPHLEEHLESILAILMLYRQKKRQNNVMDFDDLLENWLDLLIQHGSELSYKQRTHYILVDEYQDTNQVQANILEHLSYPHRNLMVVGDDAQSIYSWRGANFRNILDFPEKYSAVIYRMEQNYRSTPEILEAANASINQNQNQFKKHLFSHLPSAEKPTLHYLLDPYKEAETVIRQIHHLRSLDLSLNDICILYRTHAQSAILQLALNQENIPYVIYSGVKFFEQAHIKDVLAFLRIIHNPLDEIAWFRVLKMLPGIGPGTASKIYKVFYEQQAVRLTMDNNDLQRLIPAKSRDEWNILLNCFKACTVADITPSSIISRIHKQFYKSYLYHNYENARIREADVDFILSFAAKFSTLEQFLAEIAISVSNTVLSDVGEEDEQQEPEDALILTTIHQAKGLEWKAVFVIGLTEEKFPNYRCLHSEELLEEERRLFYVAMTRAKKYLMLTSPLFTHTYGTTEQSTHSRFVEELPESLIDIERHPVPDDSFFTPSSGRNRFYF